MKKIFYLKPIVIISVLLFLFIITSAVSYSSTMSKNISSSVFRLHVIANSDSEEDQALKLLVRNNLINYMNSISINANSKQEAIEIAKKHETDFYNIAQNTILENGYNYKVKIEIGNFYFPTKNYGDISFPAGNYDALKVEIGEAERKKLVVRNVSPIMFCRYFNRNCS